MSGGISESRYATFKNKKLAAFLNNIIVNEVEEYGEKCYPYIDEDEHQDDDYNSEPIKTIVKKRVHNYFDLAYLFGIRNSVYGQKGDKRLTKKEVDIVRTTLESDNGYSKTLPKGRLTSEDEKSIRVMGIVVETNQKGKTAIYFSPFASLDGILSVLMAISKHSPKTHIKFEQEYEDWDYEGCAIMYDLFVIKNGQYKHVISKSEYKDYTKRQYFDAEEWEE